MNPVLLLLVVIAGMALVNWYKQAPASAKKKLNRKLLTYGGIGLLVLLALSGHLDPLVAFVAALIPLAQRLLGGLNLGKTLGAAAGAGPGGGATPGVSEVRSRYLVMRLDHASGRMTGVVIAGSLEGRALGSLPLEQILALYREYQHKDGQSAALLEAYLDRTHTGWRAGYEGPEPASHGVAGDGAMSRSEARAILGVPEGAARQTVVDAHRRLMQKLHPDRGGSTYLAAKINKAKDVLLGRAG